MNANAFSRLVPAARALSAEATGRGRAEGPYGAAARAVASFASRLFITRAEQAGALRLVAELAQAAGREEQAAARVAKLLGELTARATSRFAPKVAEEELFKFANWCSWVLGRKVELTLRRQGPGSVTGWQAVPVALPLVLAVEGLTKALEGV